MLGNDHLHIDENDQITDWLARSLRAATKGTIKLDLGDQPAVKIEVHQNKIIVDLLQPGLFRTPHDETGLFDKLKTTKEFSQKLTDNEVTLSFLRKGKEAITIGKDAKPTLSKLITRSDDIQINSLKESSKLKQDLKTK